MNELYDIIYERKDSIISILNKINFERILRAIIVVLALWFVFSLFYVIFSRVNYPFELEWMEGQSVSIALRVLEGKQIYTSPSMDNIPSIYTPLYYYVSAIALKVFGISYFSVRMVSVLSTVIIMILLYWIVFKKSKKHISSIIAIGLFSGFFNPQITGAWYDIARVDMFYILLCFVSFILLKYIKREYLSIILSSLFISAAILTKQTAFIVFGFMAVYLFIVNWKKCIYFSALTTFLVSISFYLLQVNSNGYFWKLCFDVPSGHTINLIKIFSLTSNALFIHATISLFLVLYFFMTNFNKDNLVYLIWGSGVILSSLMGLYKIWGYLNNLIFIGLFISMIIGFAYRKIQMDFEKGKKKFLIIFYLVIIQQFLLLSYFPPMQIPDEKKTKDGYVAIDQLKALEGNVFVEHSPIANYMINNKFYSHTAGILDFDHSNEEDIKREYKENFQKDFNENNIEYIVVDNILNSQNDYIGYLDRVEYFKELKYSGLGMLPVTGAMTRPTYIYKLKSEKNENN